jgi:phosphoglycerate dehydrogenase-like enzyme
MPLDDLWTTADLFCFQMNVDKTKNLLTVDCLRKLKRGARLVCCGLPNSCSESDLLEALNSGQIAALALDLDEGSAGRSRKLIEHPNVVCTPALCDATFESQVRLCNALVAQIQTVLQGKVPPECVNPQVLVEQLLS